MHIIRTIIWVVLLIALLVFTINNWNSVEVKIWEGLVLETKIPALVILSFLIGVLPLWLFHRGSHWQMSRRISTLETAARNAATAAAAVTPAARPAPAPASEASGATSIPAPNNEEAP